MDPETLDLKSINKYMHQGSENYMILVKDEEQLHKLFPNFKKFSRTDGVLLIKE